MITGSSSACVQGGDDAAQGKLLCGAGEGTEEE
jgi:hypothetical protein